MKSEQEVRESLKQCCELTPDYSYGSKPCPLMGEFYCCEECSTGTVLRWVLGEGEWPIVRD